jgi:hypothetical protein
MLCNQPILPPLEMLKLANYQASYLLRLDVGPNGAGWQQFMLARCSQRSLCIGSGPHFSSYMYTCTLFNTCSAIAVYGCLIIFVVRLIFWSAYFS